MISPWLSPYGHECMPFCPDHPAELPYHLRTADQIRADEPWTGALYLDGPDPAVELGPAAAVRS